MNIPDDVMEAALDIVSIIREHKNCEEEYNTFQIRYREAVNIVARALLSERESATKAERERCAERFEIAATELGRQECCGFATSDHECCADPLYMISDRDGARAIRNGADFVPAAAIRKGDGE